MPIQKNKLIAVFLTGCIVLSSCKEDEIISVTGVEIDKNIVELTIGSELQLNATVFPDNATNKEVAWSSGSYVVADVDDNGMVTAKSEGAVIITVTTVDGGKKNQCRVIVMKAFVAVTGVTVEPTETSIIKVDEKVQLTATIIPPDATNQYVNWKSDDPNIATVTQDGTVTAVSSGRIKIYAVASEGNGSIQAFCTVTVEISANGVTGADTWVATDALGREIGTQELYGEPKGGIVGIFYFLWLGAHGYDALTNANTDQAIPPPNASDISSPFDISKILNANPSNPQYGTVNAFHHWSEPHFNYYVSNDEWVIEKHIQLLADAGVDVLFLDATNSFTYLSTLQTICNIMRRMRTQGRITPKFACILWSHPSATLQRLYDVIYSKSLYRELWFEWKGKPLVLCPEDDVSALLLNFFTFRPTWFGKWFGAGKDKWTWGDYYPQACGWHDSPAKTEQISVSVATHATTGVGRSYSNGQQPAIFRSDEGLFFAEQWSRALDVNPEIIFITGWNEWVAQHLTNGASSIFLGKPISNGDSFFVDQYNEEYSRDIEPMRGGFGDNYYYQMVDNIRRYKGVQAIPAANGKHSITIDGDNGDWLDVAPVYYDDEGDITQRNHYGWGRIGQLVNTYGRNDFVMAKTATDNNNAFFYARTVDDVALGGLPLQLFIRVDGQEKSAWEGFHYRVDVQADKAELYISKGGWNWEKTADVPCRANRNFIELSVSLQQLGLTAGAKTIDFKWADNMLQNGDIRDFMDHGDTAPNARFRYRYILNE